MTDLTCWAAFGAIFGIAAFYKGFINLKRKRMLEDLPHSKIRSIAMGPVEVQGIAHGINILTAPFSASACVYYKYKIEEERSNGKNDSSWVTIQEGDSAGAPFYLQDETGKILVCPVGYDVELPNSFSLNTGVLSDIPANVVQFLDEKGVSYQSWFGFQKTLRFTEQIIADQGSVFILGDCMNNHDNIASAHRMRIMEALRKVKANPELMKRFDTNHDGNISLEEWEIARQTVEKEVSKMEPAEVDKIYLGKSATNGNWHCLSNQSQRELVSSLGTKAFFGVFGGAALFLTCLAYLVSQLEHFKI